MTQRWWVKGSSISAISKCGHFPRSLGSCLLGTLSPLVERDSPVGLIKDGHHAWLHTLRRTDSSSCSWVWASPCVPFTFQTQHKGCSASQGRDVKQLPGPCGDSFWDSNLEES